MVALAVVSGLIAGCQGEFVDQREQIDVVPVWGRILVDGEPLALPKQVRIVLHPDEATKGKFPQGVPHPAAMAMPDGTFKIGTYLGDDGAPTGQYRATFEGGQLNLRTGGFTGGLLEGQYNDPAASEYMVEVSQVSEKEKHIDLGTFELTSPDKNAEPVAEDAKEQ